MLEGKALVVAIMMLTAAPLVVTDDGRAIVGDVTRDVTDMFADSEPLPAENPGLDEILDDADKKTNEKDLELDRKDPALKDTKEDKSCYYLDEVKENMSSEKKDKGEERKDDSDIEEREDKSKETDDESEEGSRSGNESESEKDEYGEEFYVLMEELKLACEDGNEESCEELRFMIAEIKEEKGDDIQLVIGDDGVVYYEEKDRKDWDKEDKGWDELCLTTEEWKEVFEKDRKEKDGRHKHDHNEMSIEDMIEMFGDIDEEDIAEIKQITNMSDEEWDQMIVKFETNNMTEEDWMMVMEKMELVFEHEMKEERAEMEAFRAQMKEFDDACEAGNETACEELEAMMAEVEEDFREDKEGCDKEDESEEEYEDESEEESEDDESDEDDSDDDESEEDIE